MVTWPPAIIPGSTEMPNRPSWSVMASTATASTPGVADRGPLMVLGATAPMVESVFGWTVVSCMGAPSSDTGRAARAALPTPMTSMVSLRGSVGSTITGTVAPTWSAAIGTST